MARRPEILRGRRLAEPIIRPIVETRRLRMRPYELNDAPAYAEMQCDESTVRYLRWPLRTIEESHQHLIDRLAHDRLVQRGDFLALAVYNEFDDYVGDASMRLSNVKYREVELGWIVTPEARGLGIGIEMGRALLRLAFGAGMVTARAEIERANVASQRVAQAIGMQYVGTRTEPDDIGRPKIYRWFEIGAEEWRDE